MKGNAARQKVEVIQMKHNLQISIGRTPSGGGIVRCRTVSLRERFVKLLFGQKMRLTVIVPGNSVEQLSITELPEDDNDERA